MDSGKEGQQAMEMIWKGRGGGASSLHNCLVQGSDGQLRSSLVGEKMQQLVLPVRHRRCKVTRVDSQTGVKGHLR